MIILLFRAVGLIEGTCTSSEISITAIVGLVLRGAVQQSLGDIGARGVW
jgi:hypothetical protein